MYVLLVLLSLNKNDFASSLGVKLSIEEAALEQQMVPFASSSSSSSCRPQ